MLLIKKIIKENFSRKDLNKMLEIEKQYFLDYQGVIRKDEEDSGYVYDEQDIGEMFDDCEIVLGAYSNDELVGYVALSRGNYDVGEKPDYYIYNFMVDAKLRGQKLGTILLIRISEFLKEKDFDFLSFKQQKKFREFK